MTSPRSNTAEAARMDPAIKAKWVAALRSGLYLQGRGELRSANECFCCLGVLCDIKNPSGWQKFISSREDSPFSFESTHAFDFPPFSVREWAGLNWSETTVTIRGIAGTLDDHNDAGRTFAEIADAIEAQL